MKSRVVLARVKNEMMANDSPCNVETERSEKKYSKKGCVNYNARDGFQKDNDINTETAATEYSAAAKASK